jgi:hypothetical protein
MLEKYLLIDFIESNSITFSVSMLSAAQLKIASAANRPPPIPKTGSLALCANILAVRPVGMLEKGFVEIFH